jgi:redox-sensitive bicupin YhaK (pirin superfamily)
MSNLKSIRAVSDSPMVNMGPIRLRQPIPNRQIENVDPFILLHHYGPYAISEFNNPFDLGPHPHRGFEPITLLYKGAQLHRDSLGNEMLVKAGDVQWTTAGRGIVHAEGPTREFVLRGGELEGIQLWLNLPAAKKMIPAAYQHVKSEDMNVVENADKSISLKVVAGEQKGLYGRIETQTPVNVYMLKSNGEGEITIDIAQSHETLVYLLDGEAIVNKEQSLKKGFQQMVIFNQDGGHFNIRTTSQSNLLILSGEPIKEKVVQHGPYVMNTQTEVMEAMRDYQQGKMGFLPN